MSDKQNLKETLSALLDHEAGKVDALELRRLARALETDNSLLQDYRRFALASAVLRGEKSAAPVDLLPGIQQRLHGAAADNLVSVTSPRRPWRNMLGQWAVAVSVALVTVWLLQNNSPAKPAPAVTAAAEHTPVTAPVAVPANDSVKLGAAPTHRLLTSQALGVSAGNAGQPAWRVMEPSGSAPARTELARAAQATCVVAEQGVPAGSGLRAVRLPEGYVLCRLDQTRQHCQAVSAAVACSLP